MKGKTVARFIFAGLSMLLLIFDSKTALSGANDGIRMCIYAVIPPLFPFFFLSILLTGSIDDIKLKILRPLGRCLRIPNGSESLVLIGLLGGYPIGAQSVSQAYENGQLNVEDAQRMLAFCNNCGPAFIFGILSSFFENAWILWVIWGIHVLSALLVGYTIPGHPMPCSAIKGQKTTLSQSLRRSIHGIAQVCGWVILFRMLITFLERWIGFLLPDIAKTALWGLLELANGCLSLHMVSDASIRFVLCSAMLSFGGLCVTMQTYGVVSSRLNMRLYFPGKLLQCAYSTLLSGLVCYPIFGKFHLIPIIFASAFFAFFLIFFNVFEKKSSILRPIRV